MARIQADDRQTQRLERVPVPGGQQPALTADPCRGRPIRVKLHGSVLHAMLWVGLAMADGSVSEERLEAEFDVVHLHDAVDGAFAQFMGQREDIHRYGS